jgi:1,4-dihydroxy-2-naphthoate octaprenyltransferase
MNPIKIWLHAARPKTLTIAFSPVFLGTILAMCEGNFSSLIFFVILITAMGIQIGANLANDYFDALKGSDTAERIGPVRVTQSGLVSHAAMQKALILTFSITALAGLYLAWHGGWIFALLTAMAIFLAIIYTAGPFSLSYLGIGDLFTFLFFGPIALASTYFLQTHLFSWDPFWIGMAPGAFSCAVLTANNLRDIDQDRKANKKTLPVRFGALFGKWEYACMLLIPLSLPLFYFKKHPFSLLSLIILFPAIPLIRGLFKNDSATFKIALLPKTAKLLLLYTLFFAIGWML